MADNFTTAAVSATAPLALPVATKQLDDASHAGVTVVVDASGARAKTLAITAAGAAKTDGSAVTQPVSGPVTDAQLRATPVPVSGTVSTSGLTDTQLRATAVPVSGPLSDTQLRATAVPVSGTFFQATQPVSGTVSTGGLTDAQLRASAVPVSGTVTTTGLTDTQLRATAVPVSNASLPLPAGASTEATLALIKAKTDNIDVLLSTRTKPADTQPVSAASLPLPALAATSTKQSDGTQKSQIVDGAGNVIAATANALDVNIKSGASSGTQYTEDAVAAADPIGTMVIAVRRDTLSITEVSADGDNIAVKATNKGQLHVKLADTVIVDGSGVTQPVSGTVTATGPLTDAQLRATAVPVSGTVSVTGVATEATLDARTGILTETAPASDTASSGINGRLQRIAQRLTSLIGLFPTALGGTTSAGSFPVVLSSDGPFSTQTGSVTETAPATDTASSGLNGRLQRIAQRLTSLIALLPTSLGAGGGLKVDGSGTALPISGTVTANAGTGTLAVSLASVPSHAVTNAGTFAVQATGAAANSGGYSVATGTIGATKTDIGTANTAGQVGGWYIYNSNVAAAYVQFFNAQASAVTLGTTAPVYSLGIPGGSAANVTSGLVGIQHATAISIAITTTRAGSTGPTSTVDYNIWYKQ